MSEMKLLTLLRDNTSINNPLSQAALRAIPGASEIMGYKNTFAKRIIALADALNTDINGKLLPDSEWEIVFPGYREIVNEREKGNDNISGIHLGKIYYNHQAAFNKLRAIEEKQGILHLYTEAETPFSDKLMLIQQAIDNEKMLVFNMQSINENGEKTFSKSTYLINPYKIVYFKCHYWLICNRRYLYDYLTGSRPADCNHIPYKENHMGTKMSKHIFIYRIDKMENVKQPLDHRGQKRSTIYFPSITELGRINTDMFYEHNESMSLAYNEYSFTINWDKFPKEHINDYSFVQDTFGNMWKYENGQVSIKTSPQIWKAWKKQYGKYLTDIHEEFIPNAYSNGEDVFYDWNPYGTI